MPVLDLPADRPRPPVESHRGARWRSELPPELVDRLRELCRREEATLFMGLLAGFVALLARSSGQEDVALGTPVTNRPEPALERLVGLFVNTLVLRTDASGDPTFRDLLARARTATAEALAHQDVPFEELVKDLRPERDLSRNPLFQVMFNLQDARRRSEEVADLELLVLDVDSGTSQFDLTLNLTDTADGLICGWEYATDLFDAARVARVAEDYRRLLEEVVAEPGRALSALSVPAAAERRKKVAAGRAAVVEPAEAGSAAADRPPPRHRPPRTPVETAVAEIWADLLDVARIGLDDRFFDLGGHSLLALHLASRVRDVLGVDLTVRALFEAPTLEGFAARVAQALHHGAAADAIRSVPRTGAVPVSWAQRRFWVLHVLNPEDPAYHLIQPLRLRGAFAPASFARALAAVERRHEVLRTVYAFAAAGPWAGEPVQRVRLPRPHPVPVTDLSGLPDERREAELLRVARWRSRQPFDLAAGPVWRSLLVRLGPEEHAAVLVQHHVATDGWSLGILVHEVTALYRVLASGMPASAAGLPELAIQYGDFAAWQRQRLQGEALERALGWWRERLAGAPEALALPADRPRPRTPSRRSGVERMTVGQDLMAAIDALARREGATRFMALLAAFSSLLGRRAGQDDVVVGAPESGRERPGLEHVVGCFINTLMLRLDLAGVPSFRELVSRARDTALEAYAHAEVPFERVVEAVDPARDTARPPIFQVMLVLQEAPPEGVDLPGLEVSRIDGVGGSPQVDLVLDARAGAEGLACHWIFNRDLFDATTVRTLGRHFRALLAAAMARPDDPVAGLPLLTPAERHQVSVESVGPRGSAPAGTVECWIEERARAVPEAIALEYEGAHLGYGELLAESGRLARRLAALGVGPETRVAVCLERGPEMVVAVLAVLRAGGAYLPLDPGHPAERLAYLIGDASVGALVTTEALLAGLPALRRAAPRRILLDRPAAYRDEPEEPAARAAHPEALAYVIYTSGSTGKPKGVQIPRRAVAGFLASMARRPGLEPDDALLAVTTLSFDISVLELFLPLTQGARVVLASSEVTSDGERLAELLARSRATVLQATPATWRMLVDAGWTGRGALRALCGGEALPRELAAELLARTGDLWNVYGPTETTVWSGALPVAAGSGPIPVGGPVAETSLYAVDRNLRLAPPRVPGEARHRRPERRPRVPGPALPDRRALRARPLRRALRRGSG